MRRITYIIILFLGWWCQQVAAQTSTERRVKEKISQTAAGLKTMQCDFVQTKHLKMLNDNMISRGKMYYSQADKLRWEYQTPYSYIFILNKDKVTLKNDKRTDVIDVNQNKVFKEIARIMMSSVVGSCLSDDRNFKTKISDSGLEWTATMTPVRKEIRQMYQTIILHFSKQHSYVTKVELMEKNGDKTIIELKNIRINETVNPVIFSVN